LRDLVIDRAEGSRPGIDLDSFGFELFQGVDVDRFDLDGESMEVFPKAVDIVEIPDIPLDKVMAEMGSRAVVIIFKDPGLYGIVGGGLQQHSS
jgi:hypothetical protein